MRASIDRIPGTDLCVARASERQRSVSFLAQVGSLKAWSASDGYRPVSRCRLGLPKLSNPHGANKLARVNYNQKAAASYRTPQVYDPRIALGVLNGSSTTILTSVDTSSFPVLKATSFDVFFTNRGDLLTGTGAGTLTPVPGKPPGEFTVNVMLTITGGSGEYAGATGTIALEGQAHNGGTDFNETYQGTVCGPNIKADGN